VTRWPLLFWEWFAATNRIEPRGRRSQVVYKWGQWKSQNAGGTPKTKTTWINM